MDERREFQDWNASNGRVLGRIRRGVKDGLALLVLSCGRGSIQTSGQYVDERFVEPTLTKAVILPAPAALEFG